jgi:multiple sugar transport system permease protein
MFHGWLRVGAPALSRTWPRVFILLLTLMVPGQVTIIPVYVLFRTLGWINTPLPMIVPAFFGNAFATFFSANSSWASRGNWRKLLSRRRQPLAHLPQHHRPRLQATLHGPGADYLRQRLEQLFQRRRLPADGEPVDPDAGLLSLIGQYASQWGEIMAGVVLMSLPIFVLYLVVQRHFVQGFTFAGITG